MVRKLEENNLIKLEIILMIIKDLQILMNCQAESEVPFLKGQILRFGRKKLSRKNTKEQPRNQDIGMNFRCLNIVRQRFENDDFFET